MYMYKKQTHGRGLVSRFSNLYLSLQIVFSGQFNAVLKYVTAFLLFLSQVKSSCALTKATQKTRIIIGPPAEN